MNNFHVTLPRIFWENQMNNFHFANIIQTDATPQEPSFLVILALARRSDYYSTPP
tara:strand:+ start:2016 stop:2180 length:165 start_codon:yes stop_codon:yes gene_type:complete